MGRRDSRQRRGAAGAVAVVGLALTAALASGSGRVVLAPARADVPRVLPDLVSSVRSGVIRIEVAGCGERAVGTGFLIGPRLVATVEHVVEGAAAIELRGRGGRLGTATVTGADAARDLALLRTKRPLH